MNVFNDKVKTLTLDNPKNWRYTLDCLLFCLNIKSEGRQDYNKPLFVKDEETLGDVVLRWYEGKFSHSCKGKVNNVAQFLKE